MGKSRKRAKTLTCLIVGAAYAGMLGLNSPSISADDQGDKSEKPKFGQEIPGSGGLVLATCYHEYVKQGEFAPGYFNGFDADFKTPISIGDRIKEYEEGGKAHVFRSNVVVKGRILFLQKGHDNIPIPRFDVRLYLPSGIALHAPTNENGQFTVKIESAFAKEREKFEEIDVGNLYFRPQTGGKDEQQYFVLAIVPKAKDKK